MGVNLNLSVSLRAREYGTAALGTAVLDHVIESIVSRESGTTDNKQDLVYSESDTLAATTHGIDLSGSLTAAIAGSAVSFVEIRGIFIQNNATAAASVLTVGNGAAPAYSGLFGASTSVIKVPAGGIFLWTAPLDGGGLVVTNSTADILKLDSGAASIPYKLTIWGVSA